MLLDLSHYYFANGEKNIGSLKAFRVLDVHKYRKK